MHTVDVGFTHVAFTVRCLASSIDFYTRYTAMTVIHQREPGLPSARKVAWLSDRTRCWCRVTIRPTHRWARSAISASPAPPRRRSMRRSLRRGGKAFCGGNRNSWAIRWDTSPSLPTRTVTPWSCHGGSGWGWKSLRRGTPASPSPPRIFSTASPAKDYTSKGYLGNTEHGDG